MESKNLTRRVFLYDTIQAEFEQNGYVKFQNFLNAEDLEKLTELYDKFSPIVTAGFHVTNWVTSEQYRNEAHNLICKLLSNGLEEILDRYKPVLGCYAVKESGKENAMGLHQDWSVTDESKFCGVSVWIPLVDVTENSGALKMLKGSHLLFTNIRGQKIKNQLDALSPDLIHQYLTPVPMKAGDLLILHHRIVHCSGSTEHRRIAVIIAAIPEEADVQHYLADSSDEQGKMIKVYKCPDDFYVNFDIESTPAYELANTSTSQTDFVVTDPIIIRHYNQ